MSGKEKVSGYQVKVLLITTILGTSIIFVPSIVARSAKQNGWISVLLAGFVGFLVILITTYLGRRFPDKTLIEYSGEIIGRWPGKALGFLYVMFYLITGAVIAREFTNLLNVMFLTNTPAYVITFFLILMGGVAVNKGFEVIARANEFILPLFLGSVILIFLLIGQDIHLNLLIPIMDEGLKPVLEGSVVPIGWFGEASILLILIPYLNAPNESTLAGLKVIAFVAVTQLIVFITTVGVMGHHLAAQHSFSFLNLARYIQVAEFLTRVEPLVMISWVTGVTIKISVFYFVTVVAAAQVLGLKDYRITVIPIGLLFLIISLTFLPNTVQLVHFLEKTWPMFLAAPFQIVIPLVLLIIAMVRKKGGAKVEK